jgi:Acetyltransferase (GNAT) family.
VGLINYWCLDKVYYIEHFAVSPLLRNRGYGEKILSLVKTMLSDKPIILEVEMPVGEMERRRVAFYERNGFVKHDIKYVQPPYRKNGNSINMNIMFYGKDLLALDMDDVVESLHKEVYGFSSL